MRHQEDPKCYLRIKHKYVEDLSLGSNFCGCKTVIHPFKLLKAQYSFSADFMHGGN